MCGNDQELKNTGHAVRVVFLLIILMYKIDFRKKHEVHESLLEGYSQQRHRSPESMFTTVSHHRINLIQL